jgi:hypothetical protein
MAKKKKVGDERLSVYSPIAHQRVIGVFGITLPLVVFLGALFFFGTGIQSSISSYYWTNMRDIFVGALWAIGVLLLSYKGYEAADNFASNLACVFAIGVSLFPTTPDNTTSEVAIIIGRMHFAFAALLFGTLIFFCLFLFSKTDPKKKPTKRKLQRNIVYRICGYAMALCIVLTVVSQNPAIAPALVPYNPIFWLESLAIVAFGVSWFVKGETILKDEE